MVDISYKYRQLKAMTDEEIAQMDLRSVKPDESDIFSYRPQDQRLIFGQYLNNQQEGMYVYDEVKEV